MLDPRIYRAALAPVLFALIVAAFSLQDRPRPFRTTLAPDAFQAKRAMLELDALAGNFPNRRPGDAADDALARRVAEGLRGARLPGGPPAFAVRSHRFEGETIEGERELVNVIATRVGAPGAQIVVVAHRDAAGEGAKAELSGTAALLELGRVLAEGSTRRTITLVSTSGGSGGAAGAAALPDQLKGRVDAVIVLGDMAGADVHQPWVTSYSNSLGSAPLRLRRTVEAALKTEAGREPGAPRAATQWARLAFPLTVGEQGELGRAGLPAVLLSASGEQPPAADGPVAEGTMRAFGRGALRAITALDNMPADIGGGPQALVVTQRKVLPSWAVRLLVGALLLGPLLVAVDGFARLRRRREPVGRRLRWVLAGALPFWLACAFVIGLATAGVLDATPPAPVPKGALPAGSTGQIAGAGVLLVLLLGFFAVRPVVARWLGAEGGAGEPGTAGAALLVLVGMATVAWVVNPYAAALVVPAAHAWLLVLAPGVRLRRGVALAVVAVGLLPFAALVLADARSLGLGLGDAAWTALLLVAGGHVGVFTWLLWGLFAACAVAVTAIALRPPPPAPAKEQPDVSMRGPLTYAGPGSLGGTESALRR